LVLRELTHTLPSSQAVTKPFGSESAFRSNTHSRMKHFSLICTTAAVLLATPAGAATPNYDGAWSLTFVTQQGACGPTCNLSFVISNGIVSHPNLVKFRGKVTRSGLVHASVSVQDKYAAGSGKLTNYSGRGTWSGHAGAARCFGYWRAAKS
jgi:hypothetical protein